MTFEQLRTFLWVARLGGVRRASEQMNLSQPAVSARLAALEDALKVRLFERSPRGVTLTRQGEMLKDYAEQMFFVHEEIRRRITHPSAIEGTFRVGASETIAQTWLPGFLERLSLEYPRLSVELSVDISVNLRESLLARKLDLALLMGPISDYSVVNIALPDVELSWFQAAGRGQVDFAATPVISYARNTRPYRELVEALFRRYGPGVRVYSSTSLSASIQMIAAGIGVGPYPSMLAGERLRAGQIEQFDPGWLPRPLSFTASYLSEPRNSLAERCADIALEAASQVR